MEKLKSRIKIRVEEILTNFLFQSILVFIFFIPLIATLGQYIYSGFILQNNQVLILFWPGIKKDFSVTMPVWISFGLMSISYIVGITYMYRRKTLGKVVLWGLLGYCSAFLIGFVFNAIFGLTELQQVNSASLVGIVNKSIFSKWHNPIWEELVFRAIPLAVLITFKNKLSEKGYKIAVAIYFIIPSIAFSLYHVPNHGMARIVDTFILAIFFAWLALKYSLFAPIVLHYILDATMVLNLSQIEGIPQDQIAWLSYYGNSLNTFYTLGIIILIISMPFILIWNVRKAKKNTHNPIRTSLILITAILVLGVILSHFVS